MEEFIPIVMFMCIAAVAILRPLTTRFGKLLEAMAKEKTLAGRAAVDDPDSARVRVLVEHMSRRLDLLEERLDFTERLVSNGRSSAVTAGRADPLRAVRDPELLR